MSRAGLAGLGVEGGVAGHDVDIRSQPLHDGLQAGGVEFDDRSDPPAPQGAAKESAEAAPAFRGLVESRRNVRRQAQGRPGETPRPAGGGVGELNGQAGQGCPGTGAHGLEPLAQLGLELGAGQAAGREGTDRDVRVDARPGLEPEKAGAEKGEPESGEDEKREPAPPQRVPVTVKEDASYLGPAGRGSLAGTARSPWSPRCRTASKMRMAAATDALREFRGPAIGIRTRKSHFSRTRRRNP